MDKSSGQKRTAHLLYPPTEPFDQRMIAVGGGHAIHVEQCGHPQGLPVVVLHGGPGGGCSPVMRRYFDPATYRVILFDQRGCGRSRPHASVHDNTTWHLVADMERIRTALGIARWVVFGGSWGATLALVYAETHPERVAHLVLRGVFLMMQDELAWFYGGGAGRFFPDQWQRFLAPLPDNERAAPIAAYHRRLFSGDLPTEIRHARAWAGWENALAAIASDGYGGEGPPDHARAFARLENHYFTHAGFLDRDGWILAHAGRLSGIPGTIVQGRYDMICPPVSAWKLAQAWREASLRLIPLSGHALSEPAISAELLAEMDRLRDLRL